MKALDQAFIKAYAARRPGTAGTNANAERVVSLSEAIQTPLPDAPTAALPRERALRARRKSTSALREAARRESARQPTGDQAPTTAAQTIAPRVAKRSPKGTPADAMLTVSPKAVESFSRNRLPPFVHRSTIAAVASQPPRASAKEPMTLATVAVEPTLETEQPHPDPASEADVAAEATTSADAAVQADAIVAYDQTGDVARRAPSMSVDEQPNPFSLWQPATVVTSFVWPPNALRLATDQAPLIDVVCDAIQNERERGAKIFGFGACQRGEGVTTVLLAVARRLAERGLRLALVDADRGRPQLARRLGLSPAEGWESILAGRRTPPEVVVGASDWPIAILPLCPRRLDGSGGAPDGWLPPSTALTLAQDNDAVLVDVGIAEGSIDLSDYQTVLAAMILVQNPRATEDWRVADLEASLARARCPTLGVVQNFVRE